jgi:hypothetical protein
MRTRITVRPTSKDIFVVRVFKGTTLATSVSVFGLGGALKRATNLAASYGPGVKIHRPAARLPLDINELGGIR